MYDEGRTIDVNPNELAGVYTLRVAGVLRAEVTSWLGVPHSVGANNTTAVICSTLWAEKVGGVLKLGLQGGCTALKEQPNPAIVFSTPNMTSTKVFSNGSLTLTELPVGDAFILTAITGACNIPMTPTTGMRLRVRYVCVVISCICEHVCIRCLCAQTRSLE
jgi:hypothetical protein